MNNLNTDDINDKIQIISKINECLDNKIFLIQGKDYLFDLIQIGNETIDGNIIPWLKVHYKTGNTYIYTIKDYLNYVHNAIINRIDDNIAISELEKKYMVNDNLSESLMSEAEQDIKNASKRKFALSFIIDSTPFNDEDKVDDKLEIFVNNLFSIIGSLETMYVPSMIEHDINSMLVQCFDIDGNPINNNLSDVNTVVTIKTTHGSAVLYDVKHIVPSLNAQVWKLGIPPFSWSGKKITKNANLCDELNNKDCALSSLDKIKFGEE